MFVHAAIHYSEMLMRKVAGEKRNAKLVRLVFVVIDGLHFGNVQMVALVLSEIVEVAGPG